MQAAPPFRWHQIFGLRGKKQRITQSAQCVNQHRDQTIISAYLTKLTIVSLKLSSEFKPRAHQKEPAQTD